MPRWPRPVGTVRRNCSSPGWALSSRLRTLTPPHSRTILAMAASITGMASRMERYVTVSAPCRGT